MPVEMPRGMPFSVGTWSQVSKRKRRHFLTHAHKDHCNGILTHCSFPIYSIPLTKSLVLHNYPQSFFLFFLSKEI
uniref:5' exonuclease Apollo n=1 Tax=Rhizophora mucronata TaxID=61149 RepID=A0A2P2Q798_RHIMU